MFRKPMLICAFVCLAAVPAVAETVPLPEGTITLASMGLYVRLAASAEAGIQDTNICGAAVNTDGVARATLAVVANGRVFLSGAGRQGLPAMEVAAVTLACAAEPPTPAPTPTPQPVAKAPEGLGAALARLFGAVRS